MMYTFALSKGRVAKTTGNNKITAKNDQTQLRLERQGLDELTMRTATDDCHTSLTCYYVYALASASGVAGVASDSFGGRAFIAAFGFAGPLYP